MARGTVYRFAAGENDKVINDGPIELTNVSLKSGSGAAICVLYDASSAGNAGPSNEVWVLDASQQDVDNNDFGADALLFKNGCYAKLEQGVGLNVVLCVARVDHSV